MSTIQTMSTSIVVTHQADQLPVKPTHDIWPLLRLGSEDSQAGHEHRSRFLVERGLDELNLGLRISPAFVGRGGQKAGEVQVSVGVV